MLGRNEQSVLCSPSCQADIAKNRHVLRISGLERVEFLCSPDYMAEREGLTSTAFVLPSTMANFCCYHQRYQSLATVAHLHFTSIDGKINRAPFGSNGSHRRQNRIGSWDKSGNLRACPHVDCSRISRLFRNPTLRESTYFAHKRGSSNPLPTSISVAFHSSGAPAASGHANRGSRSRNLPSTSSGT